MCTPYMPVICHYIVISTVEYRVKMSSKGDIT